MKVITGVRRCGKSYLLNNIYYNYLRAEGVAVLLFNHRGALLRAIKAIKRQKVHPASRRSTLSRVEPHRDVCIDVKSEQTLLNKLL